MKKLLMTIFFVLLFAAKSTVIFAFQKTGTFIDVTHITPVSLNSLLNTNGEDREIIGYLHMALFEIDGDTYNAVPSLAESVEVSKDKKTYTYTLNQHAKWSDGSPVTSEDLEFTYQKMMDPKVEAAAQRSFMNGTSFEKVDAAHFKFKIDKPRYNTIEVFNGFAPVQKKQFEAVKDFNKAKENLYIISNGPYKVKSISRDQVVVLERDKNWWAKDLPFYKSRYNFDEIQFKIIGDETLRYETFMQGKIDTITLSADQFIAQARGADKEKVGDKPNSGKAVWADQFKSSGALPWYGMGLNQKSPILSSKKVRQALTYLVDYKTIIDNAFFKTVEQCLSPFGSRTPNLPPEMKSPAKRYHYDVQKALALLQEDGWADTDHDNILDKEINGVKTPLKISFKYYSSSQPGVKAAQIMKESFKKAGIVLELKPTDGTALYKDFEDKNFDAVFMGWGGGSIYPDPRQNWHSDSINNGSNMVSYSNPEVDRLIDQANNEFDRSKRQVLLQKISRILYEDVPYIFLVERPGVIQGMNSRVKAPKFIQKYGSSVAKDLFFF